MNTSPASNPFTGLKGALAGLMSGGWLGLLLGLLFRRRIAPMLAALESLFAQWKAGTLPMPPAAPLRPTARTPTATRQAAAPSAPRARCRVPTARRRQIIQPAVALVRPAAAHPPAAPRAPAPPRRAPHPPPNRARCRKNAAAKRRPGMPNLLRYHN
jgi:predicted lipid-binding transport protein (Tim44 family)